MNSDTPKVAKVIAKQNLTMETAISSASINETAANLKSVSEIATPVQTEETIALMRDESCSAAKSNVAGNTSIPNKAAAPAISQS